MEKRRRTAVWAGAAAAAVLMGSAWARGPEDDLALVKRATADEPSPAAAAKAKGGEPKWLKVRVHETTGKKAKVVVNLPLSLVRAMGDDVPFDWRCGDGERRRRCSIKLSEILSALEAGQDLVQIESEDATVRVWVE